MEYQKLLLGNKAPYRQYDTVFYFLQIVSGGPKYFAEYAIIGTNCTSQDDDICIPPDYTVAVRIFKYLEREREREFGWCSAV